MPILSVTDLTYKALTTAQPIYLHSMISVRPLLILTLHLLSLSLDHLHLLFWESPIAHFAMHHLISGINFLSHSASLAHNTLLMMSHSNSPHTCSPLSPSHIHCFIPGSKLTFSTILFHHSLLAPTWTAFSDYTGPDLLCSTVFIFSYFTLFYF